MTRYIDSADSSLSALPAVWGAQNGANAPTGGVWRWPQTGHLPPIQLRNGLLNPSTGQRSKMQTAEKLC